MARADSGIVLILLFFCWEYILLTLIAYYATAVSSRPKITIEN